jgi:1-acyl-sn-glycerol-3-phosphate acyltransferase
MRVAHYSLSCPRARRLDVIPELGPQVPRRESALLRALGRGALALLGWRFVGRFPNVPKCVVVVAPHTSNWDFVIGIAAMFALGLRIRYLGKHTLFRFPLAAFMRATGGIPVDRNAALGVVEAAVETLKREERIVLGIAPEGTRKRVEQWKSGYYRIATGAGVPILPIAFDYSQRAVVLMELFQPTGDHARDEALLRAPFKAQMARHPEAYSDGAA